MKNVLILVLLFFSTLIYATHNRGGEITYKKISELKYEITVTTYTYTLSAIDRPELKLDWGDNTAPFYIQRTAIVYLSNNHQVNIYKGTHTFPGPGDYIISMTDNNRNDGVINIPNSVNIPLYIETLLRISPSVNNNQTTKFGLMPIFIAQSGTVFKHNITTYNLKGDMLTYKLVPCKGNNGQNISGYSYPSNLDINPITGEIKWNVPNSTGFWNFAVKISRWQNNVKVGYTIRDFQITVYDDINTPASFLGCSSWATDNFGGYVFLVDTNQTLNFNFDYKSIDATGVKVEPFSEVFLINNSAIFDTIQTDSVTVNTTFSWTPDSTNARLAPYIVTFRGTSGTTNSFSTDLTVAIYVGDTIPQLSSPLYLHKNNINTYPNPVKNQIIIELKDNLKSVNVEIYNISGKLIYKRLHSSNPLKINLSNLEAGTYILKLSNDKGINIYTKKIIKTGEK